MAKSAMTDKLMNLRIGSDRLTLVNVVQPLLNLEAAKYPPDSEAFERIKALREAQWNLKTRNARHKRSAQEQMNTSFLLGCALCKAISHRNSPFARIAAPN